MLLIIQRKDSTLSEFVPWEHTNEDKDAAISDVYMFIDIHEVEGDLPSIWRIVNSSGAVVFELDAIQMTPEQRTSMCGDIREEGHKIFESNTQPLIDEVVKKILEGEN